MPYTDDQWATIKRTLPAKIDDATQAEVRARLDRAWTDFLREFAKLLGTHSRAERARIARSEWAKISKGAWDLEQLYRNRCSDDPPRQCRIRDELRKQIKNSLFLLRVEAKGHIARQEIEDDVPEASPRAWFHYDILKSGRHSAANSNSADTRSATRLAGRSRNLFRRLRTRSMAAP